MKILIVAATNSEIEPLRQELPKLNCKHQIQYAVTGVGMVNTAFHLGSILAKEDFDFLLNIGIAGSYDSKWPIGSVVEVREEIFADLGVESPEKWLDLEQLGLPLAELPNQITFYNRLLNPCPSQTYAPKVIGLTVNTIQGETSGIEKMKKRYWGAIETMESAAFFLAALLTNKSFLALRGISNYVEPRNRENWRVAEAIKAVNQVAIDWLKIPYVE